jgi:hypothetical protein
MMGFIEVTELYSKEKILINTKHVTAIDSHFSGNTRGSRIHFAHTSRNIPIDVLETLPELRALVCDGIPHKIEE